MTATVHHAGPVVGGAQRCLRCGTPVAPVAVVDPRAVSTRILHWQLDTLVALVEGRGATPVAYVIAGRLPGPDEPLCVPREEE